MSGEAARRPGDEEQSKAGSKTKMPRGQHDSPGSILLVLFQLALEGYAASHLHPYSLALIRSPFSASRAARAASSVQPVWATTSLTSSSSTLPPPPVPTFFSPSSSSGALFDQACARGLGELGMREEKESIEEGDKCRDCECEGR